MTTESGLGYTLRPPRSYTPGRKTGQPSVIVIHTTEGHEKATSAEDGAAYDARRTDGTSTHFFVDSNSIVQCVRTSDEAHAARAHGNDIGIQIEICGTAGQSPKQWADAASAATIKNVAKLCAQLRNKYGQSRFPLTHLPSSQVRAGAHGFCGHIDITYAFPEDGGTHTDPGRYFPWSLLFDEIRGIEEPSPPARPEETGMDWSSTAKYPDGYERSNGLAMQEAASTALFGTTLKGDPTFLGKQFGDLSATIAEISDKLDQLITLVEAQAEDVPPTP